jgi:hypothetical protein
VGGHPAAAPRAPLGVGRREEQAVPGGGVVAAASKPRAPHRECHVLLLPWPPLSAAHPSPQTSPPPPTPEVPDPGTLMDMYGSSGIDFIVDTGPRVTTATTVGPARATRPAPCTLTAPGPGAPRPGSSSALHSPGARRAQQTACGVSGWGWPAHGRAHGLSSPHLLPSPHMCPSSFTGG